MLVISRKVGDRIQIGESITLTVVKVGSTGVKLGIEAPAKCTVMRSELIGPLDGSDGSSKPQLTDKAAEARS